jgi:hypothetical protein
MQSRDEKTPFEMIIMQGKKGRVLINYRAIATTTAPPTMATTSRAMPVGRAAALVCRPGLAVAVGLPVAFGVMTVIEVMVLRVPSGMVVVLSKVEVLKLVCSLVSSVVRAEVVERVEVDEVLVVVVRVEGALVVV